MIRKFFPYAYVNSVFSINYRKLYRLGFRGIIFDIDNTLVPHGADSTPEVDDLFEKIHKTGLQTLVLSNNTEERVLRFLKNIDSQYICNAEKPDPKYFRRAVKMMCLPEDQIICIGDQVFTDVFGANRAGLKTILVKFIGYDTEKKIGIRRRVEKVLLGVYRLGGKRLNHACSIVLKKRPAAEKGGERIAQKKEKKLFCEISPFTFALSREKERLKRHLKNTIRKEPYAEEHLSEKLPVVLHSHSNTLIKTGKGIDPVLQENKAVNIRLACEKLNGLVIHPGEVFSFWHTVGNTTRRKGYKDGRVLINNKLMPGTGGGLCNLANTIHLLVMNTPMDVTELHNHSDALAPDTHGRVPYSTGTSVDYNYIDFRFKNNTDQDVQLLLWCDEESLFGEIRSTSLYPYVYRIYEEDHHFSKEGDDYYRISKIYRETIERESGNVIKTELLRDNHSKVMFDHSQIPEELIR